MLPDPQRPVVLITAELTSDDLAFVRSRLGDVATIDYRPAHPGWDRDPLIELLDAAVAVIAGGDAYDAAVLAGAPRLRLVARIGAGFDRVDVEAATDLGVYVTTTPGANADSVADHATGLIIALVRGTFDHATRLRAGDWKPDIRRDVSEHALGLVGLGAIGSRVARRAQAMDMSVSAYDPHRSAASIEDVGVRPATFEELLRTSDIVSLHLPLQADTRQTMDSRALAMMPRGSYLVNTARGGLVDEAALLLALDDGHIAGAGLDVFVAEPATGVSAGLAGHARVIATPHISASTQASIHRSIALATESVSAMLAGEVPPRALSPVVAPRP